MRASITTADDGPGATAASGIAARHGEAPRPEALGAAVAAAFCAILLSIGLARFAYTPLLPAMVNAHWFSTAEAAYLGAANLGGYLLGALAARSLPIAAAPAAMRWMMVATAASLFACAWPAFAWFMSWRLVSGVAGAMLMILAPSAVLAVAPPARRGLASGLIFASVGPGIVASGVALPWLLRAGVAQAWLAMGAAGLVLTAAGWRGWPAAPPRQPAGPGPAAASPMPRRLRGLYLQYALNAAGLVPHMLFLADYVARGLGRGVAAGSLAWTVFGCGAVAGPVLSGMLADLLGTRGARRVSYAIQIVAIALPALTATAPSVLLSAVIVGAAVPGVVPVMLASVRELVPEPDRQRRAWGTATIAFALGQAAAAYAASALLVATGSFVLLFACGAGLIASAALVDLTDPARSQTA